MGCPCLAFEENWCCVHSLYTESGWRSMYCWQICFAQSVIFVAFLWFRWWSKGTKWREKRTLEMKLGGQRTGKSQSLTQSLQRWIRSLEWFMDYHPLLISCHLAALPCTLGIWLVRSIFNFIRISSPYPFIWIFGTLVHLIIHDALTLYTVLGNVQLMYNSLYLMYNSLYVIIWNLLSLIEWNKVWEDHMI